MQASHPGYIGSTWVQRLLIVAIVGALLLMAVYIWSGRVSGDPDLLARVKSPPPKVSIDGGSVLLARVKSPPPKDWNA